MPNEPPLVPILRLAEKHMVIQIFWGMQSMFYPETGRSYVEYAFSKMQFYLAIVLSQIQW